VYYRGMAPSQRTARHISGTHPNHKGTMDLVPVCKFLDVKNPGLGTFVVWETYAQKSLNYDYEWTWVDSENQFGWKQKINTWDDEWDSICNNMLTEDTEPQVKVFFSKGMKGKIPKLLEQNDNE